MTTTPTAVTADAHHDTVRVQVKYVGSQPFNDGFIATATVQDVKLSAMRHFSLEVAMADKYVLKLDDMEIPDNRVLGAFGQRHLAFELTLKHEVPKG